VSVWRHVYYGVRSLWNGAAADRRVDEEVQQFLDEAAAAHEADGMSPAEARRAAERRVGNALAIREDVRASGWEHVVETFVADARYGLRRLARSPGFTIVTVATLALGIGSASAMLSVGGPVLVQMLPFPDASRIRVVWERTSDGDRMDLAFGSLVELQQRSRSFEIWAAANTWQPTLTGFSTPERLAGQGVTADYFRVFGISPRLGRDFAAVDDVPQAARVVIISDRLWRRVFDASPSVIGRQVVLDGSGYVIVGVMPATFAHRLMPAVDVWRAMQYDRTLPSLQGREWGHHLRVVARLRAGVMSADAMAELAQIARWPIPQIARPPWASLADGLLLDPLHADLTREVRPAMVALVMAAALLLLIAVVNVINLMLGRNAQRRAEFAMRTALGAGRSRLARQLLTETLMLVSMGGAAALFVAYVCVRALAFMAPAGLPQAAPAALDAPVLLYVLVVTMIAGVAVGVLPALVSRDLSAAIPRGKWHSSSSPQLTRRSLVVAQVAFALVLLVGAGLLFQTLRQLFAIGPGFDPDNVLAAQVQVASPRVPDEAAMLRYFEQLREAVQRVPGVSGAALGSQLPLSGDADIYGVRVASRAPGEGDGGGSAFRYAVSQDYFTAMGIPLREGRLLTDYDHAAAPRVAVISESLARRSFPNGDAIGQRMQVGPPDRPPFTVVGVVGDVKQLSLETEELDAIYTTPAQWHFADRAFWIVVRARADAAALMPAIRSAIWSIDQDQPIVRLAALDTIVADTARLRRFALVLFEAFGVAALLLTAVGIYGVTSSGVTDRVREIGVSAALGASRPAIVWMVISEGAAMAALGIAIGLAIAAGATRGLDALLFGVSRFDPVSYAVVTVLMIGVSAASCWLPARRAARIDPAITLRTE
jgi:putative ABC transport system permease protein